MTSSANIQVGLSEVVVSRYDSDAVNAVCGRVQRVTRLLPEFAAEGAIRPESLRLPIPQSAMLPVTQAGNNTTLWRDPRPDWLKRAPKVHTCFVAGQLSGKRTEGRMLVQTLTSDVGG